MNLRNILIIISSVLMVISVIPYLIDIIKKKTKPRLMSWLIWSVLNGISCAASLVDHQYSTAIFLSLSCLGTISVVILGWGSGIKKILPIDIFCLVGAIVGLILWAVFNSPSMAVLFTIAIDLVGCIPTFIHSWNKPQEETWVSFVISLFAAVLTLFTVTQWRVTAYVYPIYFILANLSMTLIILLRRRQIDNNTRYI